jgi:cell division septation protein DedD
MIFRNLIFEPKVIKQRLRAGMVPHHKQQASECDGEQQHRELWPAYNPNIAPPQAPTEGLFQQTQAISLITIRL